MADLLSAPTSDDRSAADSFFGVAKKVAKVADKATKPVDAGVKKYFDAAKTSPFGAVINVLGAPQRAALAFANDENMGHAIMHPDTQRHLIQGFKNRAGLQALEDGPLRGNDLPHKLARGLVDTGADLITNPVNAIPVGRIAGLVGKIPAVAKGIEGAKAAIGGTDIAKGLRGIFSPNDSLHLLTPHAKATVQAVVNRSNQKFAKLAEEQSRVIARNANAIRAIAGKAGAELPSDVVKLFHKAENVPLAENIRRPQDVLEALAADRGGLAKQEAHKALQLIGLSAKEAKSGGIAARLKEPGKFFVDSSKNGVEEAQKQVKRFVDGPGKGEPNKLADFVANAQRNANQAFLALPFAHGANLANLAYDRYGPVRTLQGIGNAARIATGVGVKGTKLEKKIHELEEMGAHSQYGNIFNELGFTDFGIKSPATRALAKAVNVPMIAGQRAANKLQNVFLNPVETGLRTAALDAEKRAGKTGADAAASIHGAFGSEPANAITRLGQAQHSPFIKFHLQTAPGSFLRTLATNPGRINTLLDADRDINHQVNPHGAKYHLSTPTFSGAKMISDPIRYAKGLAGPLSDELTSDYSTAGLVRKGKVREAVLRLVASHVPLAQAIDVVREAVSKEKGRAGETALQDALPLLAGGYYSAKY